MQMGNLTFKEVDHAKYPAVDLAYSAGRSGGTMTGVLSAANEKVHFLLSSPLSYSLSKKNSLYSAHLSFTLWFECVHVVLCQIQQNDDFHTKEESRDV